MQVGIASLGATIKKDGHQSALFDTTFISPNKIDDRFKSKLADFNPDVVAISCRSLEWGGIQKLLPMIPDNIFVVVGGVHASVAPEKILEDQRINGVILGEGEEAFAELLSALETKDDIESIKNLWLRKDGEIIRNEVRPLIENLDSLPYADWDLFDPGHLMNVVSTKKGSRAVKRGSFETSRGCPFHCAYCINAHMQKMYKGKGRYHRAKSVDCSVNEILHFKKRFDFSWVYFIDETLIANKKRAQDFFTEYEKKVKLPFSLMVQPKMADEQSLALAAKAGGEIALIGIESGDEEYREKMLARKVSDQEVLEAFANAKKAGLATYSFNIVGFPGETKEMIRKTIDLNRLAKPDVVQVTIFYPFPGTALFDECVEKGYLPAEGKKVANYYADSVLDMPTLSKDEIRIAAKLFPFHVQWDEKWNPFLEKAEQGGFYYSVFRFISFAKILRAGIGFAMANRNNPSYLFRRISHFLFGS